MRIGQVAGGSPDCPLVRHFDFIRDEAQGLHSCLAGLASGDTDCVLVHELPFASVFDGCRLTMLVARRDQAIVRGASAGEIDCRPTRET
jgi:hypothetical protein